MSGGPLRPLGTDKVKACNNCDLREGERCYREPVKRGDRGYSLQKAEAVCDSWRPRHGLLRALAFGYPRGDA